MAVTAPGAGPDRPTGGVAQLWERFPWLLRWAVLASACLLLIAAGLYLLGLVAARLAPLTIAIAAALFLCALLDPVACWLRRLGVPSAPAALLALLVLLGLTVGSVVLIWNLSADEFGDLSQRLDEGVRRTRDFLASALPVEPQQLDKWGRQATAGVRKSTPDPLAGARTVVAVAATMVLILVLLFFLLKDGRTMWAWVLRRVSERSRPTVATAGRYGWRTLAAYSRGIIAIAAIDAIGIGVALIALRVPLALPLILITFLGAFVPIIGATVAGGIAVLVALAGNGPTTALLTATAVIGVQQLEGNLLEPLIMRRQVRLHPIVVLVMVTAGTLLGGVVGAFVAVPITAVGYRIVETVADHRDAAGRAVEPASGQVAEPPPDGPGPGG